MPIPVVCAYTLCGKQFSLIPSRVAKKNFCSNKCSQLSRIKTDDIKCSNPNCSKMFRRKPYELNRANFHFCSRDCMNQCQTFDSSVRIKNNHKTGFASYRERAFRFYPNECKVCGYNKHRIMLDVDHVDSDRTNNCIENLQILCVMHHAEKTRGLVTQEDIEKFYRERMALV